MGVQNVATTIEREDCIRQKLEYSKVTGYEGKVPYSTVTLLARFRGKSMGQPLSLAA